MAMDLELVQFLFSVGFVILGSIVFHISTLISGYSIYQEKNAVESSFLSLASGIVIFLYSPIVFIVFSIESENFNVILDNILDAEVIRSFLSCAIGLGLIFGYITILDARKFFLIWFREKSGIKFWIHSYSISWDDILNSIKKGGEISVRTEELGEIHGKVDMYSIRKEPKQIVLDQPDGKMLILGDEIQYLKVPEKSFKKHHETMNHVAQAYNCVMISVGIFLLAFSADNTCNYFSDSSACDYFVLKNAASNDQLLWSLDTSLPEFKEMASGDYSRYQINIAFNSLPNSTDNTSNIESFYIWSKCCFLIFSILFLALSVLMAERDFQNWRSYLKICPEFLYISSILSIAFIYLLFQRGIYFKRSDDNSGILLFLNAFSLQIIMLIIFLIIVLWMLFWTTRLSEQIQNIVKEHAENRVYKHKSITHIFGNINNIRLFIILFIFLSVVLLAFKDCFCLILYPSYESSIFLYLDSPRRNTTILLLWIITSLIIIHYFIKTRNQNSIKNIIYDVETDKILHGIIASYHPDYSEREVMICIYNYLDTIRQNMYISLCLNEENKSHICELTDEAIATYKNYDRIIARMITYIFVNSLNKFKDNFPHMLNEDVNILLVLDRAIKERIRKLNTTTNNKIPSKTEIE